MLTSWTKTSLCWLPAGLLSEDKKRGNVRGEEHVTEDEKRDV